MSVGTDGKPGDGDSPAGQGEKIAISYDGSLVAFSTKATNLGGNILVRSLAENKTSAVSTETASTVSQPAMSRNGSYLVFGSNRRLDSRFQSSGIFAVSNPK
jgi:Tol biopolymer transport system component